MNNNDARIQQFKTEVDGLKLKGSSGDNDQKWLVVGVILVVIGVALAVIGAVTVSTSGGSPADQRANMAQGSFLGIALLIVGAAVFLRYSLARYMRFWLVRMTYENRANTDRIVDAIERAGGLPSTLETPLFADDAYEIPLTDAAGQPHDAAPPLDPTSPPSAAVAPPTEAPELH